jgi:hypothetical protein
MPRRIGLGELGLVERVPNWRSLAAARPPAARLVSQVVAQDLVVLPRSRALPVRAVEFGARRVEIRGEACGGRSQLVGRVDPIGRSRVLGLVGVGALGVRCARETAAARVALAIVMRRAASAGSVSPHSCVETPPSHVSVVPSCATARVVSYLLDVVPRLRPRTIRLPSRHLQLEIELGRLLALRLQRSRRAGLLGLDLLELRAQGGADREPRARLCDGVPRTAHVRTTQRAKRAGVGASASERG